MFLRSLVALAAAAASMFGAGPAHATGVGAPLQIDVYNPGEKRFIAESRGTRRGS
ncbi:metallo-beta-lactamase family protein [Burkholderia pseudomallei]|nr:metallo-beta-lactamase family protein [Burkholderia pseudomallei]